MYRQITSNKRKSIALLFGFLLLYGALGWLLSLWFGQGALFVALGIAAVMLLVNLFMGDDLVATVAGARRVERREDAPQLWGMVENLSITAGLPMPRLYVVPDESPNAFAAGRSPKQAIVAVTTGLLERLDEEELEGVLAHEMSHIRNYDVRLMTWAAVLAGSIAMLASIFTRFMWFGGSRREGGGGANPIVLIAVLVGLVLAPVAAILIQMAISRRREYVADASAAELTRYPQGLASALSAISEAAKPSPRLGNQAIAHLMIAPPLSARGRTLTLFATHPPTEDRIARLSEMAGGVEHRHETLTEGRALPRSESAPVG
ncbi:MAG: M48 family metallopeptidase [Solirubrobacterales bacterium]